VRYAIASNGFPEGPAQALRDYLVGRKADVVTIFHPLLREQGTRHLVTTYADGVLADEHVVRVPVRAPVSYVLDPLIPLVPPRVDVWFGFNPLACARGLLARGQGRASFVALWSVDFVPDRFGRGTLATRLYDRIDRFCCVRANGRIELSAAAREERNRRHGLTPETSPAYVVPIGAWLDRVPSTTPESYRRRHIVFLGHLVQRQGVDVLLEALALLAARNEQVSAEIIGTGPLETELRTQARRLGLADSVDFRGYVEDHREIEGLLARSSVAVAPYATRAATFTRYADPGKLKAYLAAGLPIVLTDVPPNAKELARHGGAEIVADDAAELAEALSRVLASPEEWRARREAALEYATKYDWNTLLPDALTKLGVSP
jgi:glycosyltransferase involved in cell wall biosynthesis